MFTHPFGLFGKAGLTVDSGTVNVSGVTSAHNAWLEIWTDNGGSPGVQLGVDSDTLNISTAGEKTFTFSTPVPLEGTTNFWIILQEDGGDVNYLRHTAVAGTGVDGGDLDLGTTITDLVSGTTEIPRFSVLLSDGQRLGNRDTGATAFGMGPGGVRVAGLEITIP